MIKLNVHFSSGFLIGMGITLLLLGSFEWFSVGYMYGTFSRSLEYAGVDVSRHYIFRELKQLISVYMTLVVAGFVSLILGILIEKKRILNVDAWEGIPYGGLINGLWGAGGALALVSLRFLFYYLLASDYFYLKLFIVFEPIGIILVILGIVIYTRKQVKTLVAQEK